jgi:hypothetical protein
MYLVTLAIVPSAAADGIAGRIFTVAGPRGLGHVTSIAPTADGGFVFVQTHSTAGTISRFAPDGAISVIAHTARRGSLRGAVLDHPPRECRVDAVSRGRDRGERRHARR